jgi:hypothetical protein
MMTFSLKQLLVSLFCLYTLSLNGTLAIWPFNNNAPQVLQGYVFIGEDYQELNSKILDMIASFDTDEQRFKLMGDILRIAVNDLLDYDPNGQPTGGSDGCLDMTNAENVRLIGDLWTPSGGVDPEFLSLYNTHFSQMTKADFWAASAVIILETWNHEDSVTEFQFRWNRQDASDEECDLMQGRAPDFSSSAGCNELETKLINRMNLTWEEVVALMGYHTLGFDNHERAWTLVNTKNHEFDNLYYRDLILQGWVPSQYGNFWDFGGSAQVVMYPSDLCLYYDLQASASQCCTNTNNNCIGASGTELPACVKLDANDARRQAVEQYANLGGAITDYETFYSNFAAVFRKLSMNGYVRLFDSNWLNNTQVPCHDRSFQVTGGASKSCSWVESMIRRCNTYSHYCPRLCGRHEERFYPQKCYFEGYTPFDPYDG